MSVLAARSRPKFPIAAPQSRLQPEPPCIVSSLSLHAMTQAPSFSRHVVPELCLPVRTK